MNTDEHRLGKEGQDDDRRETPNPESIWMSELGERRWAVLSERGSEAAGLTYEEASALVGELRGRDVSGLCVITGEAATAGLPVSRFSSNRGTTRMSITPWSFLKATGKSAIGRSL